MLLLMLSLLTSTALSRRLKRTTLLEPSNQMIFSDLKLGIIFVGLASLQEERHTRFGLNFTMMRNFALDEIKCGKKRETTVVSDAWKRLQKSLK